MKITTDLTATSRRPPTELSWSPADLFVGGAVGTWFDPSDTATLFQDAAGTIPVTGSGQPVGLMLDKSGNARHATQSVSSARPAYMAENGYHWLEFDGVDDRMQLAASLDLNAGTIVLGLAEAAGRTATAGLISPSAAGYIAISGSGTARSLGKNSSAIIRSVETPATFPMTAKNAVSIRIAGGTLYARRWPDPTEYSNATSATANLIHTNTLMAFSSGGALPAGVSLYGMLLFEDTLAQVDIDNCLVFANRKIAP